MKRLNTPIFLAITASLALVCACGDDSGQTVGLDANSTTDGSSTQDGGASADAQPQGDVGMGVDTGIGGTDASSTTAADASVMNDGSVGQDAGVPGDGGTPDGGSGLAGLGDTCTSSASCDSTYCYDIPGPGPSVCSECQFNGNCGVQQACQFVPADGYASCVGTGDLGDSCNSHDQCASGFCNTNVCSECNIDMDCAAGGTCVDDTQNSGYYVCTGGLGDPCATGSDCGLGYCYNTPGPAANVCSECEQNGDCGVQQACDYSFQLGYAECVGTGNLGDSCTSGDQCAPGSYCNSSVCSECLVDADCGAQGTCLDDTANSGYFVCLGGLGETCNTGANCASGLCYDPIGIGPMYCSLCESDNDCGPNESCTFGFGDQYARCTGDAPLGDACVNGPDCASGFCNNSLCSECAADTDCPSGSCIDDTANSGYYLCASQLGEFCQDDAECASGYCYVNGGGFEMRCSECRDNADCPNNGTCTFSFVVLHAVCL